MRAPSIRQEGVWCIILHAPHCLQTAVVATGGSLAALGDSFISQLSLAVKVNSEYIGPNDVITADRDH